MVGMAPSSPPPSDPPPAQGQSVLGAIRAGLRWSVPLAVAGAVALWFMRVPAPATEAELLETYSLSLRAAAGEEHPPPEEPAEAGEIQLREGGSLQLHLRSKSNSRRPVAVSISLAEPDGVETPLAVDSRPTKGGALLSTAALPARLPDSGRVSVVLQVAPQASASEEALGGGRSERRWSVPFSRQQ